MMRTIKRLLTLPFLVSALTLSGCSIEKVAIKYVADALAGSGNAIANDPDPDLVRDAAPFSLKLMDSLILQLPEHTGLLLSACRAYTQYAYAFLQLPADEIENSNISEASRMRARARGLYRKAMDYGRRAIDIESPGLLSMLETASNHDLIKASTIEETDILYWTTAAWAGWLGSSVDDTAAIADIPQVVNLLDLALSKDETLDHGALHTLAMALESLRSETEAARQKNLQGHYQRAIELSENQLASPHVSCAEKIAIPTQDKNRFRQCLDAALAIRAEENPATRLENTLMQRRAKWLLDHTSLYFLE